MLKAAHSQTAEEILILAPRWKHDLSALRQLDHADLLVCPGCRQPVRVKAGELKRWHFAHKHLANCPFEKQSPLLLATRAVLYEWLVTQFGEEHVALEKLVEGLPRPLDAYVAGEFATAYWIFDTRMPPDERDRLREKLSSLGANLIWVFAAPILQVEVGHPGLINLTTTEREFRQHTTSDAAQPVDAFLAGDTLHYLDAEAETLITYRNLGLRHPPQSFIGRRLESPLSTVQVDLQSSDFLHPGEAERIAEYRQRQQHRQEKMHNTLPKLGSRFASILPEAGVEHSAERPISAFPAGLFQKSRAAKPAKRPENQEEYLVPFARTGTCKNCGKQTDDWVSFDGRTGTCVCRDCSGK
jgi:hypothetical protein